MRPITYPKVEYQPLDGFTTVPVREFKGVSTYDSLSIEDAFFSDISNMQTDDYPTLTVRPGYTLLGAFGSKVLGLGVWKDQELHAVFNDGTWRRWNGSSWSTLASGLNTSAQWSFSNFQGNQTDICLFGTNGIDGLRRYDGSTVSSFGDGPSDLNYITTFSNRLWGASKKTLHACALDQPDKWQLFNGDEEDSYFKDLESTRGEDINMLSGGMSKLTIGMPNSIHELYGGVPSDFTTRLITEETGFGNNQSVFVQDGIMSFIHQNGIYEFLSGGVGPDRSFSDIVKRYTLDLNSICAGTDGKKFYFNIQTGKILVYDPRLSTWTVYTGINATCFANFQNQLYIGVNNGRVLKLGGTSDAGSPISWYATTKTFNNASVAQKMKWVKLWTFWELAAGSTMNVYFSKTADGNDWELIKTITGTGTQIQRIILPVNKFQLENMVRIKFQGTGWARLHEHTRHTRALPLY
ncbi:hypothetical protein [Mycobacterium tuberculosis]|uniref:hypothetical protein n=1 Tax=Mycobacterium tuberculosis TaxID=1773 RepID=UPI0012DC6C19|nr:hypothetical protein [Mycobacterium tuberculosis]